MQHTLDNYIGNLLFYHECVVVPGFGAFLTRSFSAEINPATHMLRPPSKRVVFNARIQDNDGLLAQHIARLEGKSYRSALENIEISVRGWKKALRAGRKVNLSGIGRLFMDEKGKLQFNPAHDVNYDIYSYGLNIFRANAMEREQEIKRGVTKAIEKHQKDTKRSGVKISSTQKNTKSKTNWTRWVATLGPVAALLVVGGYFYVKSPNGFSDLSGTVSSYFGPASNMDDSSATDSGEQSESSIGFSSGTRLNKGFGPEDDVISENPAEYASEASHDAFKEESQSETSTEKVDEKVPEEKAKNSALEDLWNQENFHIPEKPLYNVKKAEGSAEESSDAAQSPNNAPLQKSYARGFEPIVKSKPLNTEPKPKAKPETITANKANSTQNSTASLQSDMAEVKAQIIVGAFSKEQNAQRYMQKLQSDGWEAYTYKSKGLNRVAIGRFKQSDQAMNLLSKVKQEVNYQAWVNIL